MRALKTAVVVMGILFVGGLATLVTLLVQRMSAGGAVIASAALDEPAGTRIAAASAAAQDRLVVQLQGGGPDRVVVLDTRTGRVLGRVGLAR